MAKETTQEKLMTEVPVAQADGVDTTETANDVDDTDFVMPSDAEETVGGKERYYEAVGRRKESVAQVRLYTKKATDTGKEDRALMTINGQDYIEYFKDTNLITRIEAPLRKLKSLNRFKVTALIKGGGISGQSDALRHGIARALEQFDANFRKKLKKSGYLTRDSREKERRKYGKKRKARKSPQWSKR